MFQLESSLRDESGKLQLERDRVAQLQLILDNRPSSDVDSNVTSPGASPSKEMSLRDPRRDSAASGSSRMSKRSTDLKSEDSLKDQVQGLK